MHVLLHEQSLERTETAPASEIIYGSQFVKSILPTWTDLTLLQRRDFASAISCTARACGVPSNNLPLDCAALNAMLKRGSLPDRALSRNARSRLRRCLRRMDLHTPSPVALRPDWQALYNRIPNRHRAREIIGFLRFCSQRGGKPDDVRASALTEYELTLRTATLCNDTADRARGALACWNWARTVVPGWPSVELTSEGKRKPYTFHLDRFPEPFQADVKRFINRIASTDLDQLFPEGVDLWSETASSKGPTTSSRKVRRYRAARPRTVATRLFQIIMAASALIQTGCQIEDIVGLRSLVDTPTKVRQIATFFWERAGRIPNGQAAGILEVLRQIAQYHCGLPEAAIETFTKLLKRLTPDRQFFMTEKNSRRLRVLADDTNRAVLLHLSNYLMTLASDPDLNPAAAARLAMSAVALEVLIVCPIRLSNLQQLTLTRNLLRLGPGGRDITHICIPSTDTKNHQSIDWPLPTTSAKLIDRYIGTFRPPISNPGNEFLFPGKGTAPRSIGSLRITISEPIANWVGATVNPHLLRHFAAWSYLKQHPGAYEIVRRILGHRRIETTIRYYTGLEAEFAAVDFDATVLKDRQATRSSAAGVFRKKSKKKNSPRKGK